MGIANLTRHLVSLSESVHLGDSASSSADDVNVVRSVVIDGPSFVYHVNSTLSSWADPHFNPFERQPTCDEVSTAVALYLLLLQNAKVNVYVRGFHHI
jgi:hypothetical protein